MNRSHLMTPPTGMENLVTVQIFFLRANQLLQSITDNGRILPPTEIKLTLSAWPSSRLSRTGARISTSPTGGTVLIGITPILTTSMV